MYEKILIPTDGSKGAEVAVEHALEIADRFDAEVHTLYVVDVRVNRVSDIFSDMLGEFEEVGENATAAIEERIEEADLDAVTEVVRGIPSRSIREYAEENSIDLIVMGTHGNTGLDRLLLGSTTEKVLRTSEVPVMTVRREE